MSPEEFIQNHKIELNADNINTKRLQYMEIIIDNGVYSIYNM